MKIRTPQLPARRCQLTISRLSLRISSLRLALRKITFSSVSFSFPESYRRHEKNVFHTSSPFGSRRQSLVAYHVASRFERDVRELQKIHFDRTRVSKTRKQNRSRPVLCPRPQEEALENVRDVPPLRSRCSGQDMPAVRSMPIPLAQVKLTVSSFSWRKSGEKEKSCQRDQTLDSKITQTWQRTEYRFPYISSISYFFLKF